MGIAQPGPLLQGYEVMVEAVVLGGRWPLGGDKRKNTDYHKKDGQLCYYLLL